ncbi:hypothetical protein ACFPTY_19880 [Halomonas beimenensis]|uniref:hypothetical protein n=1 Tax=Halomonas beimenensis TaxID=475662 RepID=UPI00362139BE
MAWGVLFFFFMAFNLLEASLPSLISKEAPAASKARHGSVLHLPVFSVRFSVAPWGVFCWKRPEWQASSG